MGTPDETSGRHGAHPVDADVVTDDFAQYARHLAGRRVSGKRFTSEDLVQLARARGYTFMREGLLRVWVHRGVFPPAPERIKCPGERNARGVWGREDALRLLDVCVLHTQNTRARALRLGTWLHGYALSSSTDGVDSEIQDMLAEQLGRIETALYGRALADGSSPRSDAEDDTTSTHISHAVEAQKSVLLDELCRGLNPAYYVHDPDYEDIEMLHPQGGAGTSFQELSNFSRFLHGADRQPVAADAVAALQLHLVHVPLNATMTDKQLTELHRRFVVDLLIRYGALDTPAGYTLPSLQRALAAASTEVLHAARAQALQLVVHALREIRLFPDPALSALVQLGEHQQWDLRRIFASPLLFPLTAYLVAALVYVSATGAAGATGATGESGERIIVRGEMIPIAMDRLARMANETVSRADAMLAVLLTVVPKSVIL